MRTFAIGAFAALLLASAGANAQLRVPALYGELGYTWSKISGSGVDVKPGALRGIVGYDIHPNFAVEGMLAVGVNDDSQTVGTGSVTGEVQHALGLYLKPKLTVVPNLDLFARLGYADSRVKFSAPGFSLTQSKSDWSYGAGLTYSFNKVYTGLDYMRYYNKEGVKADGVTLSVGYHF